LTAQHPGRAAIITVAAPAKLNLYLHVVGRRGDGYHLLDSLFAFASVGDVIAVRPAQQLSLAIDGPFARDVAAGADNLVLRAAHALAQTAGVATGARITLTKHLPVASGIGGGSSDAAATLRALRTLWRLKTTPARLRVLAASLGADVPACVGAVPCFVGGVGEIITRAPGLPPAGIVLANPGVLLPTPSVFKARSGGFSGRARFSSAPKDAQRLATLLARRRNDLTDAARRLAPAIDDVLAALQATENCLLARLSGSGATCFGLYATEAVAQSAARQIALARPGWWVRHGTWFTPARLREPTV
jgi:4-diphosphocytidyl-2-C-methyl-D-erythritol kinase